jgi:hypothetical protein
VEEVDCQAEREAEVSEPKDLTPSCIVDNVLVIYTDDHLSREAVISIRKEAEAIWPNRKVAVLSSGLRLGHHVSEEAMRDLAWSMHDLATAVREQTEALSSAADEEDDAIPRSTYLDGSPVQ